jgi:hypothetical protein
MSNQSEKIRQRNAIEDKLVYNLNYIIETIKKLGIKDTGLAQKQFGDKVNEQMRGAAFEAFSLGAQEITNKLKTVYFPSTTDLEIVKNNVAKYSEKFWYNVHALLHRNDVLLQKNNYEPRSELNSNYMATKISIALVTTSMSLGTAQKARVLQSNVLKSSKLVPKCPKGKHWDTKLKKCVDDDITTPSVLPYPPEPDPLADLSGILGLASLALGDDSISEEQGQRILLVWNAILDNKTCPLCESYDGSLWNPNDPNLPVLGSEGDIHDNCRCFWDSQIESI